MNVAFLLYFVILVWIITFKCNLSAPVSDCMYVFQPMSVGERLSYAMGTLKQLGKHLTGEDGVLNMLVFVPLGIFLALLPRSSRRSFSRSLAAAVLLTVGFETVQLFTCIGAATASDVVANTLGFIIGYFLCVCIFRRLPDKTINYINAVIIAVALPIAVAAFVNTAYNIEIYNPAYYGL